MKRESAVTYADPVCCTATAASTSTAGLALAHGRDVRATWEDQQRLSDLVNDAERAIVNRLNQAINASLQAPELRDRLRADASSGPVLSPEGYGDFMRKQALIWEKVITPLKLEMTQ